MSTGSVRSPPIGLTLPRQGGSEPRLVALTPSTSLVQTPERWPMTLQAQHVPIPVAVRCIGGPPGTCCSPWRPTCFPSGVFEELACATAVTRL